MSNYIESRIRMAAEQIDAKLTSFLSDSDHDISLLFDAMRYSALAGGKRIRPFITVTVSDMLGGRRDAAETFACALEMVHTYSLIHDDLPCMDNDDLRRGKPTNHKVFGEGVATLAGDALLTYAFEIISCDDTIDPAARLMAVQSLSRAAGPRGMVGGQIMDISDNTAQNLKYLEKLQSKKTGALIECAARLGCIVSGADDIQTEKVLGYASRIGLAFQIKDDILDLYGSAEMLGKSTGSDERDGKTTFMTFMSRRDAEREVARLTEEAVSEISDMDKNRYLTLLAEYLAKREK